MNRQRFLPRLALALWIAWAVVAWNVVFDHTVEVAGREYLHAAAVAAHAGRYERIDAWMEPAVARGIWRASGAALAILAIGIAGVRLGSRALMSKPGGLAEPSGHPRTSGVPPNGGARPDRQRTG